MRRTLPIGTLIAIAAIAVTPVAASAGVGSGETTVSGTLSVSYSLTPPSAIDLGAAINSPGDITKSNLQITVITTDSAVTTCGITVADKDAATKGADQGKLKNGSGYLLKTALMVSGGDLTGNALMNTTRTLRASSTPKADASISNFGVMQNIDAQDFVHPGSYSMTLLFTATFN